MVVRGNGTEEKRMARSIRRRNTENARYTARILEARLRASGGWAKGEYSRRSDASSEAIF